MSTLLTTVSLVLFLVGCHVCFAGANRPAAPVNVSVTHLRTHSAMVSWNVPEGEAVIGYAISQQRQDGLTERFIREVNTTSHACVLWDLDENTDYIIQVQSIGLQGESQASKRVHFRTLENMDHFQSNMVAQDRPAAPVNVSVTHLRTHSAMVSWNVPEGEAVIGYAISQQRQDGLTERFIREVNTTSRACVLWDLDENTDYIIQVQSIGLQGESQASKRVHFRTLEKTDQFQSNMVAQGDPSVEGLDISRHLQTGEMLIIMTVLLMWAAVIALFCRQYDIIKDNDSNNHSKEKAKPLSVYSTPDYHSGSLIGSKLQRTASSVSIIKV